MRRPEIFYGWYIVAAGAVINACVGGLIYYGFTALVNPIANTFGWSYAQISLAMTLRGLETGALNPVVGLIVDRFEPKRLIFAGVIIAGFGLLCLSQVTTLALFYLSFVIFSLGNALAGGIVTATTIARWFKKDMGKAQAVLTMGMGSGGFFIPILVTMTDAYGWQTTLIILAFVIWIVGMPLSFAFRSRPEEYGLLPDGRKEMVSLDPGRPRTNDPEIAVRKALGTRAFWYIGIAWMLQIAATNAVVVHVMPYLVSQGVERSTAGTVAMALPIISLTARFPFGWLADNLPKKYVIMVSIALTSAGMFLFSIMDTGSLGLLIIFIVVFGLSLAGFMSLWPPLIREYFGSRNFGAIYGMIHIFITFGMIVSPPAAGWWFDTHSTYHPAWLILGAICLTGIVLVALMPRSIETEGSQ
ncbi:MAG: MFS transporter [Chloroflexota bacterium]